MKRITLDSSACVSLLTALGPSEKIQKFIRESAQVFVPTLVQYEVYKKIKQRKSEDVALQAISFLRTFELLELTQEIALSAADLSLEHKIGMADAIILASAYSKQSILLTLDNDFAGLGSTQVIR